MDSSVSSILKLPNEVLEDIILYISHSPKQIASFSSTCKSIYSIVYDTPDSHLWRHIFLSQYDDPRPNPAFILTQRQSSSQSYDWALQFKRRTWALNWCNNYSKLDEDGFYSINYAETLWDDGEERPESDELRARALDVIYDIIITSSGAVDPLRTRALEIESKKISGDVAGSSTPMVTPDFKSFLQTAKLAPTFPPCPDGLTSNVTTSLNCNLFQSFVVPEPYFHYLSGRIHNQQVMDAFETSREGVSLYRLLSLAFPTSPLDYETIFHIQALDFLELESGEDDEDIDIASEIADDMLVARDRFQTAQRKVYNMEYSRLRRLRGPFMDIFHSSTKKKIWKTLTLTHPAIPFPRKGKVNSLGGKYNHLTKATDWRMTVKVDWSFIQTARQVLEVALARQLAPLRLNDTDEADAVGKQKQWQELVRIRRFMMGVESCRYGMWGLGLNGLTSNDGDNMVGWDWAGVGGVWRRLVTWLGYETLFTFNVSGRTKPPTFRSNTIIVPVCLRVTSYDWYPSSYHLPGIIFQGEVGGEMWESDDSFQDIKHIQGRVDMLESGEVIWCMWSYSDVEENETEWISQGVQIGGLGSGAGVIGMWTGFGDMDAGDLEDEGQEVDDEPLGTWWQWKVYESS